MERSPEAPWDKIAGGFLTLGLALLGINATLGVHPESAFWTSGLSLTAYGFGILAVVCFYGYLRQWPMPPIKDRHDQVINELRLGTATPLLPDRLTKTTDKQAVSLPPTPIVRERRAAPTREPQGRPRQGFVTLWGQRFSGGVPLQLPKGLVGVAAIAGGRDYSLVLTESGKVQSYGDLDYHHVPNDLEAITAIAAGACHSLAITAQSTVVSWYRIDPEDLIIRPDQKKLDKLLDPEKRDISSIDQARKLLERRPSPREIRNRERTVEEKYRQLYAVPHRLSRVVDIAAGDLHSLALSRDGIVTAWGDNRSGQCAVPAQARNVSAIAAGSEHSLALTKTGRIFAWGKDTSGQCDVPVWLSDSGVVAIAAGDGHSVALTADGKVTVWGDHKACQVPDDLPPIRAIAAGRYHTLALTEDGTVRAWGNNTYQQCDIPADLSGVVAISAGDTHNLALCHLD